MFAIELRFDDCTILANRRFNNPTEAIEQMRRLNAVARENNFDILYCVVELHDDHETVLNAA